MAEKKFDQSAYNKAYYIKYKSKWDKFYEHKLCDVCNKSVISMSAHIKSKAHQNKVEIQNLKNELLK